MSETPEKKKFVPDEQTKKVAGKIMKDLEDECDEDNSEEECRDDEKDATDH
jgi:hypothetical protein